MPRDALILRERETFVLTIDENDQAKKINVMVGQGVGRWVSVTGALWAGDEVIAVVVRDADNFEQNAQDGVVNWLDERRPMLQEYDPVNRHTIPLSGDLVE